MARLWADVRAFFAAVRREPSGPVMLGLSGIWITLSLGFGLFSLSRPWGWRIDAFAGNVRGVAWQAAFALYLLIMQFGQTRRARTAHPPLRLNVYADGDSTTLRYTGARENGTPLEPPDDGLAAMPLLIVIASAIAGISVAAWLVEIRTERFPMDDSAIATLVYVGFPVMVLLTMGVHASREIEAAYTWGVEQQSLVPRVRAEEERARLMAAESQIDPKSLFRALDTIGLLIRLDPPRAEREVLDVSNDLRHRLKAATEIPEQTASDPRPQVRREWLISSAWKSWRRGHRFDSPMLDLVWIALLIPLLWSLGDVNQGRLGFAPTLGLAAWILAGLVFGAVSTLEKQWFAAWAGPRGEAHHPDPALRLIPVVAAIGSGLLGFALVMMVVAAWTAATGLDLAFAIFLGFMIVAHLIWICWWTPRVVHELFDWTVAQRRLVDESRAAAARLRLSALQSQMQPHFLFNALNTVASYIKTDAAKAEQTLEDLRGLLRHTLARRDEPCWTLEEEIAFVRRYLDIEHARFGDRLRVTFEIDPAIASVQVPALSLQPLVENAVKHAVNTSLEGASIRIRGLKAPGFATVTVEDDGPGFPKRVKDGIGLANVRERLRTLYGSDNGLAIDSSLPGRTRVTMLIPFGTIAEA